MVKKGILIAALVALIFGALFLLTGCGAREPLFLRIGAEDNGREVTLRVDQALVLTLESNPTTGYSWQLGEFDEAVLEQTGHKYVRPWEKGTEPAETFTVQVVVRLAGLLSR